MLAEPITQNLQTHYSREYNQEMTCDSPLISREQMVEKVIDWMHKHPEGGKIIDIGSGTQSLEEELRIAAYSDPKIAQNIQRYGIVTVDIASIRSDKFPHPVRKPLNLTHLQTNALNLPFKNESFDLVISNLAIDFVGRNVYDEVYRVLKNNGEFMFHFHHPHLWSTFDIDNIRRPDYAIWRHFRDTHTLFESVQDIEGTLTSQGLTVTDSELFIQRRDAVIQNKYWTVTGNKSS